MNDDTIFNDDDVNYTPPVANNTAIQKQLEGSGYYCDLNPLLDKNNKKGQEDMANLYKGGMSQMSFISKYCKCCPQGYYCPKTGLFPPLEADANGDYGEIRLRCPAGSYCPEGSIAPLECNTAFSVCDGPGAKEPNKASSSGKLLIWVFFIFLGGPYVLELIRVYFRDSGRAKRENQRKEAKAAALAEDLKNKGNSLANKSTVEIVERAKLIPGLAFEDELKFDIDFKDISVFSGKKIDDKGNKLFLNRASGRIRGGKVMAVMGPSGCGKSTIVSMLCDRITSGGTDGQIKINGEEASVLDIREMCGFVPQLDTMHESLLVKEVLHYQGELRHDPSTKFGDSKERHQLATQILESLSLDHIRHSMIGGAMVRGISGGQRKRVNVGMELMSRPRILFLDEPTSGLDATMSEQLLDYMQRLAAGGVTVVMVIHQPNPATFAKIDDVCLMKPTSSGGKLCYCGPVSEGVKYFNDRGIPVNGDVNPADRFIDILSNVKGNDTDTLEDLWKKEAEAKYGDVWSGGTEEKSPASAAQTQSSKIAQYHRTMPSLFSQIVSVVKRVLHVQTNTIVSIALNDAFVSFLAMTICFMNMTEIQLFFVVNLLVGLISALYGVGMFRDAAVYNRELDAGIAAPALFIGRIIGAMPRLVFQTVVFIVPYYYMSEPTISLSLLWRTLLLGQLSAFGMGIMVVVFVPGPGAEVNAVLLGLLSWTFSGLMPTAKTLNTSYFGMGLVGMKSSYCRWMFGSELIGSAAVSAPCLRSVYGYTMMATGLIDSFSTKPLSAQNTQRLIFNTTEIFEQCGPQCPGGGASGATGNVPFDIPGLNPNNQTIKEIYTFDLPVYNSWPHDLLLAEQHQAVIMTVIAFLAMLALSQKQLIEQFYAKWHVMKDNLGTKLDYSNRRVVAWITGTPISEDVQATRGTNGSSVAVNGSIAAGSGVERVQLQKNPLLLNGAQAQDSL